MFCITLKGATACYSCNAAKLRCEQQCTGAHIPAEWRDGRCPGGWEDNVAWFQTKRTERGDDVPPNPDLFATSHKQSIGRAERRAIAVAPLAKAHPKRNRAGSMGEVSRPSDRAVQGAWHVS